MNRPPNVGMNTPGVGSKPLAYNGLSIAALLALLYKSTAVTKLFPMMRLVRIKNNAVVLDRNTSLISFNASIKIGFIG